MMVAFNRGDSESSMSISSLASSKRGWSVYEDETDNDTDCILEHMSKNTSKSVSFSTIDIREYPLTVGDNPGCGRGVPISIDWEYERGYEMSVDEYESLIETREDHGARTIPPLKRFEMLRKSEKFSSSQIMKHLKSVQKDRDRREETVKSLEMQSFMEILESTRRGIMNATLRRNAKKRERAYLKPYRESSSSFSSDELSVSKFTNSTTSVSVSLGMESEDSPESSVIGATDSNDHSSLELEASSATMVVMTGHMLTSN